MLKTHLVCQQPTTIKGKISVNLDKDGEITPGSKFAQLAQIFNIDLDEQSSLTSTKDLLNADKIVKELDTATLVDENGKIDEKWDALINGSDDSDKGSDADGGAGVFKITLTGSNETIQHALYEWQDTSENQSIESNELSLLAVATSDSTWTDIA